MFKLTVFPPTKKIPETTTGLAAYCDVCGKRAYARYAMICWTEGKEDEARIACKGNGTKRGCLDTLDAQYGRQLTQELHTGVGFLVNNIGCKASEIKDGMALDAMLLTIR